MADDDDDKLEQFKSWFKSARDASQKWREEARICYDFVAGAQWSDDDKALLELGNRPVITFNRTGTVIDSVSGLEVSNRQEVRYIPRTEGVSGVNDLLTAAAKWCRDECNAEDEESDAFLDEIICGIGWTETRIDYDEDPEGKLQIVRIDPMTMHWDATARRRNLADARHVFCVRDVPVSEAQAEFPDEELDDLNAVWARDDLSSAKQPHDAQEAPYYKNDQSPDIDKQTKKITLVEVQWWESEKAHRVVDPESQKSKVLTPADFKLLQDRIAQLNAMKAAQGLGAMPPIASVELKRRVYKRAILGAKVLKEWDGPKEGGFTYKAMTGKRDRNTGSWYGLVRAMIDPQKWANKWLSQVLHIINSNAKGGYWAEADAFEDANDALDTMSDPAAVTLLTPGALANNKIQPKQAAQYPEGIDRLMQFAISSIRDSTGVNLELLGMANKDQPGILEHQRKQAGMTILAGLFDSLRHYRKEQGKLMLWYITNFLSDGRLIRIGGQENAEYVRLVRQPGVAEYDVIVDDVATSPNQKEATWVVLGQMFPILAKVGAPLPVWLKLLEYSPLPSALVSDITKLMGEQQQEKAPDPKLIEAQAKAESTKVTSQAEMARANADVAASQATSQAEIAKAQASYAKTMADARKSHAEADAAGHRAAMDTHFQAHAADTNANAQALELLIGAMLKSQADAAKQGANSGG